MAVVPERTRRATVQQELCRHLCRAPLRRPFGGVCQHSRTQTTNYLGTRICAESPTPLMAARQRFHDGHRCTAPASGGWRADPPGTFTGALSLTALAVSAREPRL